MPDRSLSRRGFVASVPAAVLLVVGARMSAAQGVSVAGTQSAHAVSGQFVRGIYDYDQSIGRFVLIAVQSRRECAVDKHLLHDLYQCLAG